MQLKITYYGRLAEITQRSTEALDTEAKTASKFRSELCARYPKMEGMTFQLAQENKILNAEEHLTQGGLDVFPPFSGG